MLAFTYSHSEGLRKKEGMCNIIEIIYHMKQGDCQVRQENTLWRNRLSDVMYKWYRRERKGI